MVRLGKGYIEVTVVMGKAKGQVNGGDNDEENVFELSVSEDVDWQPTKMEEDSVNNRDGIGIEDEDNDIFYGDNDGLSNLDSGKDTKIKGSEHEEYDKKHRKRKFTNPLKEYTLTLMGIEVEIKFSSILGKHLNMLVKTVHGDFMLQSWLIMLLS
ncbi:hypothetical protein GH714_041593 [Hevea brasiliensis]|uniref:Uncharacterized protein n=1 Tax=Hevea brasiliensis TaxID=3981 RepID=A0A6A6MQT4_HEVBR|nr:hypothetical protein GH714_041593 [Hevea brasiliensis]